MVTKERDEELTLFLEMRRREKENERNNILIPLHSEDLDVSNLEINGGSSPISKIVASVPKMGVDEIFISEDDKSDYDWLLSPPGTPLFPSLEMESQKTATVLKQIPNARSSASLIPKDVNAQASSAWKGQAALKHSSVTSGPNSSSTGNRRPSSSAGPTPATSRSTTPSGRSLIPSTAKSSRASTPTSRPALPSLKPTTMQVRSSTPTRSFSRSSTPTTRPSSSTSKTIPRSVTPTQRTTPLSVPSASAPPGRPASASKGRPKNLKLQSHGSSPTKKSNSRPSKPLEIPGLSLDTPPNFKTPVAERPASASRIRPSAPERPVSASKTRPSLPQRPASASRTRPAAPSSRTTSDEATNNAKSKKQSCFPSGHIPKGSLKCNRSSVPAIVRSRYKDEEDVSPVVMGTMMVERVVNMRKLPPPKNDDHQSIHNDFSGRSSLSNSSGFGRTLSKKSLDMAIRHMDIRRSVNGELKPVKTSVPASSAYCVRSVSTKSWTASASDSPCATSSNASSEPSVNNNPIFLDGSETEDFVLSERGSHSPSDQQSNQLMEAAVQM